MVQLSRITTKTIQSARLLHCYIVSQDNNRQQHTTFETSPRISNRPGLVAHPPSSSTLYASDWDGLVAKLCCATSTLIASPDFCFKGQHPGLSKKQHQWCFESNWKKWIATSLQKIANPASLEHRIIGSDGKFSSQPSVATAALSFMPYYQIHPCARLNIICTMSSTAQMKNCTPNLSNGKRWNDKIAESLTLWNQWNRPCLVMVDMWSLSVVKLTWSGQ